MHFLVPKRRRLLRSLSLLLVLVLFAAAAYAGEIRIGGTGGPLALMKKLAAEYQKEHRTVVIKIVPSVGSTGGIKAVSAEALDIAVSGRKLTEKEAGLSVKGLGRTPFVFAVRSSSPVAELRLKELPDIYAANGTWPDGGPRRVVLRPAAEYDTALLRSMSPDMDRAMTVALARRGMIVAVTDQDCADTLERTPGAIGTTTLGQIISEGRRLKPLALDGIAPRLDAMTKGRYPYFKSYYLVTRPDVRAEVSQFLAFLRTSAAARIMAGSGYQPEN